MSELHCSSLCTEQIPNHYSYSLAMDLMALEICGCHRTSLIEVRQEFCNGSMLCIYNLADVWSLMVPQTSLPEGTVYIVVIWGRKLRSAGGE